MSTRPSAGHPIHSTGGGSSRGRRMTASSSSVPSFRFVVFLAASCSTLLSYVFILLVVAPSTKTTATAFVPAWNLPAATMISPTTRLDNNKNKALPPLISVGFPSLPVPSRINRSPDDERIRTSAGVHTSRGARIRMFSSASVDLRQLSCDATNKKRHQRRAAALLQRLQPLRFRTESSKMMSPVKAGAVALVSAVLLAFPGAAKASSIAVAGAATAAATTYSQTSVTLTTWQLVAAFVLVLPGVGSAAATLLSRAAQAFFLWYMAQLAANPIATKSVTAGVIGAIGDSMAQGLDRLLESRSLSASASSPHRREHEVEFRYDARRGLSCLLYGLLISGPLMHLAYDLFETILPVSTGAGAGSGLAAISHVLADSIFLDSLFVATTFIVTGTMEGYNRRQLVSQLKSDYLPTLRASWVTSLGLLPIEFLCFRYLPVSLRVMAVNFIDVIWDTVISFMAHRSRGHHQHHEEQPVGDHRELEQTHHFLQTDPIPTVVLVEQPVDEHRHHHHVLDVPQLAHA